MVCLTSLIVFSEESYNYLFQGFIQREAEDLAPRAILRQLRRSPTPPSEEPKTHENVPDRTRRQSMSSMTSSPVISAPASPTNNRTSGWTEPQVSLVIHRTRFKLINSQQPFEVFRAIERKDLMYLMEIRDRSFPVCSFNRAQGGFANKKISFSFGKQAMLHLYSMR